MFSFAVRSLPGPVATGAADDCGFGVSVVLVSFCDFHIRVRAEFCIGQLDRIFVADIWGADSVVCDFFGAGLRGPGQARREMALVGRTFSAAGASARNGATLFGVIAAGGGIGGVVERRSNDNRGLGIGRDSFRITSNSADGAGVAAVGGWRPNTSGSGQFFVPIPGAIRESIYERGNQREIGRHIEASAPILSG